MTNWGLLPPLHTDSAHRCFPHPPSLGAQMAGDCSASVASVVPGPPASDYHIHPSRLLLSFGTTAVPRGFSLPGRVSMRTPDMQPVPRTLRTPLSSGRLLVCTGYCKDSPLLGHCSDLLGLAQTYTCRPGSLGVGGTKRTFSTRADGQVTKLSGYFAFASLWTQSPGLCVSL